MSIQQATRATARHKRTARDRRDAKAQEGTTALLRRYVAITPTMQRKLLRPSLPSRTAHPQRAAA